MRMYQLGTKVVDIVSGFTGTVTARAEYLGGPVMLEVTPPVKDDGSLPDPQWFYEARLSGQGA
jgi:hypothetical protein